MTPADFSFLKHRYMPYNTPTGQVTIQRQWDNFNPIENPTLPSMVCNTPGTPSSHQVSVPAGSRITAYWNTYTHDVGPMVVWMVECPTSCTTWNGRGGKWFKIEEAGLLSGTVSKGKWAVGRMIQQNHTWTFGVPSKLKPGNYLLRTETIAMHAQNPQWYPNCAQIKVMGSGTASPPASYRASIPGVYTLTGEE
jgi:cellulase